jgi:predicted amidohydrolase YtcJ
VGKLADAVVLDRDYFTIPDGDLAKIRSLLTIVDGRIVHNNGVV